MARMTRRAAAFLLTGALLTACSGTSDDKTSTSTTAAPSGAQSIKIGVATDQPGVSLKDGSNYSGFDITTANYVAGKLGMTPEFVPVNQGDRVSAIESGEVDMVVATLTITDERKQKIAFSDPYFTAHQDLMVRRNDTTITGPETLHKKVLCSVPGTTSADYVERNFKAEITLREAPTFSECVRSLAAGDVDAVTTDDLILAGFASQDQYKGKLRVLGAGFTDENYGIGMKSGDQAMVDKVNAALKEYADSSERKDALDALAASGYQVRDPAVIDK